jgi:hypothetical protein
MLMSIPPKICRSKRSLAWPIAEAICPRVSFVLVDFGGYLISGNQLGKL